jgi:hypothetical protein
MESAAILDVAKRLNMIHEANYQSGRGLLIRIVSMLTKIAEQIDRARAYNLIKRVVHEN